MRATEAPAVDAAFALAPEAAPEAVPARPAETPNSPSPSSASSITPPPREQHLDAPPLSDADMSAEEWKKRGNAAFTALDYEKAVIYYTNGIELEPSNPALFSNRSAAYLKTEDYGKARRDADMCIELDKNWPKGWWRRGQAQLEAMEYADARATFLEGLTYCEGDDNLTRGLENADKRLFAIASVQGGDSATAADSSDPNRPSDRARAAADAVSAPASSAGGPAPARTPSTMPFPGTAAEEIKRIATAPNHYAILHVSPDASAAQMKKNYHTLARMLHPDKCQLPGASESMTQVSLAYDTLTNIVKRTLYDQFMSAEQGEQTYAEWEAKQQPVELPMWLNKLLGIKGCGWILAVIFFILFLPFAIIIFIIFLVIWLMCLPYRMTLRYCFPERYAQMKEEQERELAKMDEAHQDRAFAHV
jgi:tetratricopeptide (TPR) repeat protein